MNLRRAFAFATMSFIAHSINAQVLSADNEARLCIASFKGKRAVDENALALAIVTEAGATQYLDGSNSTGVRDGAIRLRPSGGSPSEPVYAVLNTGISAKDLASARPFGPNIDLRQDKKALEARDAILKIFREELDFLTTAGDHVAGSSLTYRIERRQTVSSPSTEIDWFNPNLLFLPDPPLIILCESKVDAPPTQRDSGSNAADSGKVSRFLLRGTVKDLTVGADSLASADPAAVSFQRDSVADSKAFDLNLVLGLHFGDSEGTFDAIPFVSYENKSVDGDEGDIKKLSPGILFGYKIERPWIAVHTRLEGSFIDDIQQDSRQAKLRGYLDPAIPLGQGRGSLFGSYLPPIRSISLRPDLTLIVDGSHVYSAGKSTALTGSGNYCGFGGELSVRSRLITVPPVSDFELQIGVRHLWLAGDIQIEGATRRFASLGYSPKDSPYIGVDLTYSGGLNDDTFQEEKSYKLEFTFRY